MKINFTIHNTHLIDFDFRLIESEVTKRLHSVINQSILAGWISSVDWLEAGLWIWDEGVSGFGQKPYVELHREKEMFDWGTINGRLTWSSIYLDHKHNLLQTPNDKLFDHILDALLYMLVDLARQQSQSKVASWIENNYLCHSSESFIRELVEGQQYFESEEDLILVLVISNQIQQSSKNSGNQLLNQLTEQLDEFLNQNEIGYIDGTQVGSGTIELFCSINDYEQDLLMIKQFLVDSGNYDLIDYYLE